MTQDQLFEKLRSETSLERRQQIVENGLKCGISPNEITEMLDYIDLCQSAKLTASTISTAATEHKKTPTTSSFWQSLLCPFRLW
jgi:hypothetical protein